MPAAGPRAAGRTAFGAVAACFVLSGFAALVYQTAWLRQFSIVFGTSELAVATVLAAYMAGLAAGAALAGRWIGRVRRPVLVYGLLEGGIAVTALAVPLLLDAAGTLYTGLLGGQPGPPAAAAFGQPLFYLGVGFLVLAVPTGLMGATLPLLTRYVVRSDAEIGPRVASLYALNTAGAVAGTLCTAFVLLPALGLTATVGVGVGVNVLIFVVAVALARRVGSVEAPERGALVERPDGFLAGCIAPLVRGDARRALRAQPAWMLPLMLGSGATAFFYEVLWTRMLTHVLGGSIYAFATMLAAFLAGIALGSAVAGRVARRRAVAGVAFVAAQVAIAVLSAGVYAWMQALVPAGRGALELAGFAVLVMLPATLFVGATFPLAVRVVARDERDAGPATAAVYAWNTVGAIFGAVVAGFVLIPALGFEGSIRLAVLANLGLALACAVLVAAPFRPLLATAPAALAGLALLLYTPARPTTVVEHTAFASAPGAAGRELYYGVGRSATVIVKAEGGALRILGNGLPEASVLPKGAPLIEQPHQWLTALAVAARPEAGSMLAVGLGGGVALENAPGVESIDVVELESKIVEANRRLAPLRAVDPLADPRVRVVINDARNALRLTDKRYDLIVSQPSHPWTAGASHLFTREFLALAKRRLAEHGVLVQWINASFVDEPLLRSLAATVADTFDHVRLYQHGEALFFVGSDGAIDIERDLASTGRPLNEHPLHYGNLGLNALEDFVAALVLDEPGVEKLGRGAPLTTDDRNRMATDSRMLGDGLDPPALMRVLEPYDPLLDAGSWIHAELGAGLNFAYIAQRLLRDGRALRAAALGSTVPDPQTRALIEALIRTARGADAERAVLEVLESEPGNAEARYALVEPRLAALARGDASDSVLELARGLPGSAAAVVEGWRFARTRDWQALASLDSRLAAARATDLWFPEALQLRAEWRVQVANETRYAYDALRLVDRALVLRPGLDLLMLRIAAAEALGDPDALTESARGVAQHVLRRLGAAPAGRPLPAAERSRMRGVLEAAERLLDGLTTPASESALRTTREALDALERHRQLPKG